MDEQQKLSESMAADGQSAFAIQDEISLAPIQRHEGKLLQDYLAVHHLSTEEMAKKLNVTRQAVYLQMKRMYLSTRFKKKLSELGIYFGNHDHRIPLHKTDDSHFASNDSRLLMEEIRRLQNIIVLQAEHIRQMAKIKL